MASTLRSSMFPRLSTVCSLQEVVKSLVSSVLNLCRRFFSGTLKICKDNKYLLVYSERYIKSIKQ